MPRLSIRKKIILTLLLVGTGIGLLAYLVILPTIGQIRHFAMAIQDERTDLEVKYQRGQLIKKITAEFNQIKPDKDRLFSLFVPANREVDAFIIPLERLAAAHNVEFVPDPHGLKNFTGPDDPLPLSLTLRGNFKQILRFLLSIERLPTYFNIATVSIRGTNPDRGEVVMVVSGQAFRKDVAPAIPPVPVQPAAAPGVLKAEE